MKRIILTILTIACIACAILSIPSTALAETKVYYYVKEETTMIINNAENKDEISIPKTYYVLATSSNIEEETYKTVIYNGVTGQVPATALSTKTISNISNAYYTSPTQLLTASTHRVLLNKSIPDDPLLADGLYLLPKTEMQFIANARNSKYYFVKCLEQYGFVEKSESSIVGGVIISENANAINPDIEIPVVPNPGDGTTDDSTIKEQPNALKIILITTVCILAVLVVFLIFKPAKKKKAPKSQDFYDM